MAKKGVKIKIPKGLREVKKKRFGKKIKKRNLLIILAVLILIGFAVYFTFFYTTLCTDFECYKKSMIECGRATYVNEEPEASWGYHILEREGTDCVVEVELLNAKKGELGIEDLVGQKMECFYPATEWAYPEKNLERCHGRLKEELQTIIINKLHKYLLENIEKFQEGLLEI